MPRPTLDFETYSEAGFVWNDQRQKWETLPGAREKGIRAVGAVVYSEHPSTEVLTVSYDLCDGRGIRRWRPGLPLPQDLFDHVAAGRPLESHGAMFERLIWSNVCVPKYDWPPLPDIQHCSMATARVNSLPGKLEKLGEVLELSKQKNPEGARLIKKFSIPRDPTKKDARTRIRPEDDPEDFERFCVYCDDDVLTEQAVSDAIDPMVPDEDAMWRLDQRLNWRGIGIDRRAVRDCIAVMNQVLDAYTAECEAITGGLRPGQLQQVLGWLRAHGVVMDSLDAANVERMLRDPPDIWSHEHGCLQPMVLPPECRRVLEIRALTASASVKKLHGMENRASRDDRVRDIVVYYGAHTGRPTGADVQPLNIPRGGPELAVCACERPYRADVAACPWCGGTERKRHPKTGEEIKPHWSAEMVDPVLSVMRYRSRPLAEKFFGDALLAISGCLRGLFVAGPGNELIASDYSAIEAVVTAVLAGEKWRIKAFINKEPIYLVGASKITGRSVQEYIEYKDRTGKHHPDRQDYGKTAELACLCAETTVLTNHGYKALVDVSTNDQLWDGVEWVEHRGVISKGMAHTISVDGVEMTPNHLINWNGFWKEAEKLVSNKKYIRLALEHGSANLPLLDLNGGNKVSTLESNAPAEGWNILSQIQTYFQEKALGVISVLRKKPAPIEKCFLNILQLFQMIRTAADYLIESPLVLPDAALTGIRIMDVEESASLLKAGNNSSNTLSRCPDGITPRWKSIASMLTGLTGQAILSFQLRNKTRRTKGQYRNYKDALTNWRNVYDIAFAGPRNRFTIKTQSGHLIVHNCGFGGWINAFKAFGSTLPDDEIKRIIVAWREASPAIVEFWGGQWRGPPWARIRQEYYGVEGAFILACMCPGQVQEFRGLKFLYQPERERLQIELLSGRKLTYWRPRLARSDRNEDELQISFERWNTNPKYGPSGWERTTTYGGKLTENIVQATAADIQRHSLRLHAEAGYAPVLYIYDENLCEVPEGFGSIEEFEAIMNTLPPWAAGWPVQASGGWRGRRYRKAD